MPGFVLTMGSTVLCAHAGQAQPTLPNPRVVIAGQPSVLLSAPYIVAGCALPPVAGGPCVTGQWITGSTRVTSNGQPFVTQAGQAVCVPTGTPLLPVVVQTRVLVE